MLVLLAQRVGGDSHAVNERRASRAEPRQPTETSRRTGLIILGVILLIIGFIAKIAIVWTIGIIVLVVGLILMLLGSMGRAVGGRRHYY